VAPRIASATNITDAASGGKAAKRQKLPAAQGDLAQVSLENLISDFTSR
jgi:hypothetical protein